MWRIDHVATDLIHKEYIWFVGSFESEKGDTIDWLHKLKKCLLLLKLCHHHWNKKFYMCHFSLKTKHYSLIDNTWVEIKMARRTGILIFFLEIGRWISWCQRYSSKTQRGIAWTSSHDLKIKHTLASLKKSKKAWLTRDKGSLSSHRCSGWVK